MTGITTSMFKHQIVHITFVPNTHSKNESCSSIFSQNIRNKSRVITCRQNYADAESHQNDLQLMQI